MLLKKLSIPLCDLRITHNIRNVKKLANNTSSQMTSDKTRLTGTLEADGVDKKRSLRGQKLIKYEEEESEDYEVKKVQVRKKKIVKVIDTDPEEESDESEDSSSEEEDDKDEDPDFDIKEKRYEFEDSSSEENEVEEKRRIKKEESVQDILSPVKKKLSAYEEMIQRNREEKMKFLQSLNIDEAKADFLEVVGNIKKKPIPVKRKFKKIENTSPPVLRKSRRLANMSVDLSEETLYSNALKAALETEKLKRTIPAEISFKEAFQTEEIYESYLEDVNFQESKSKANCTIYDRSILKKMTLRESTIAKVTPGRITTLSWYQSPEQLIVAAGDKFGNLGVWHVNSESNPYTMVIHLEGITNVQFSPFNQVHLISSSYDGVLRCGDMVQHKFNEIYNVSDETCCTYFDILSASTYLVAQKNGQVALVDKRTAGKSCEKKHGCHEYPIKTVNIHPANRNFFITAENKGPIRLWDLRKLQKNPVADILYHKRCVQSAYFSPITGNSILATSSDDSISLFDSTKLTSEIKLKQRMKHNNHTGRWLSVFRATWLPNSEEAFVIGSMQFPRRIEVFGTDMFAYSTLMHENLNSITSTNAFHPMKPALAGGNSGGKVFVFS